MRRGWCNNRVISPTIVGTGDSENAMCVCVCVCLFHDHATTLKPCCVLCTFSTTTTRSVIVTNKNAKKCVTLSDGDMYPLRVSGDKYVV